MNASTHRTRVWVLGLRAARSLLYRVLIPLAMRSGRLEPTALRMFRGMLPERIAMLESLPCPIHVDGLVLWYDAKRPSVTIRNLATGYYEQPIADLFAAGLRPGMVVLDIGAHVGYFSLLAARHVGPTGRVWSFEPDPENRTSLERNIESNGMSDRIAAVPLAVTAGVGDAALYRVVGDTGSSSVYPTKRASSDVVTVATTSLDLWAAGEGWPKVDLIKIDAEGAEAAILRGMSELIAANPNVIVVFEFQADALEAAGESPINFLRQLVDMNDEKIELLDDCGSRMLDGSDSVEELVRRSRWAPLNLVTRGTRSPHIEQLAHSRKDIVDSSW